MSTVELERGPTPLATIAICTRNRRSALDRCLGSVAGLDGLEDAEVLVIDNGSTDETRVVLDRWAAKLPMLRSGYEPRRGLSHARNAALRVARGDLIAFIDDDVLVERAWLRALLGAYRRWPDVAGVAGRVELAWPGGRPQWLPASREVWFARLDLGAAPRLLRGRELPVGANMSVRRDVALAVGGFDPDLGYSGTRLLGNEELAFFGQVRDAGHALGYEPQAGVVHVVEGRRLTRRYLWQRLYSQGRSDVRAGGEAHCAGRRAMLAAGLVAFSRALLRNWRSDIRRLSMPRTRHIELVDIVAGRAKQLGIAREAATMAVAHRLTAMNHLGPR